MAAADLHRIEPSVRFAERFTLLFPAGGIESDAAASRAGFLYKIQQVREASRRADKIDERRPLPHFRAILLRRATHEADDEVRFAFLAFGQRPDVREGAIFGVGADGTGEKHQDVRGRGVVNDACAGGAEQVVGQLRVEPVHLAAVGRDMNAQRFHASGAL